MATHHIPIIFLTGISGGEERAYKVGASGYVMKPYHPEKLLETINNALDISGRQIGQTISDMMGVTF
jgi:CheY-like chemotaxis protein